MLARLLAAGVAAFGFGCASPGTDEAGAGRAIEIADESPWRGLAADEAVDRFLALAIPYDIGSAHLVDHLAASYGEALAPALRARLDELPADAAQRDLRRFLLVRVGCRWVERGGADRAEDADARRVLLRSLADAVQGIEDLRYRLWLRGIAEDRSCLRRLEAFEPREASDEVMRLPASDGRRAPPAPV